MRNWASHWSQTVSGVFPAARNSKESTRQCYVALFHVPDHTPEQDFEMAECSLILVEAGLFGKRQLDRVRGILKKAPSDSKLQSLRKRLDVIDRDG